MVLRHSHATVVRFTLLLTITLLVATVSSIRTLEASKHESTMTATYSRGILHVSIPYQVNELAAKLTKVYAENSKAGDPI
jgi:hypothetical protein